MTNTIDPSTLKVGDIFGTTFESNRNEIYIVIPTHGSLLKAETIGNHFQAHFYPNTGEGYGIDDHQSITFMGELPKEIEEDLRSLHQLTLGQGSNRVFYENNGVEIYQKAIKFMDQHRGTIANPENEASSPKI